MKNKTSYIRTLIYLLIAIFVTNLLNLFDFKDFSMSYFLNFLSILIAFSSLLFTVITYKKSLKEAGKKERKELLERQPSFLFNYTKTEPFTTNDAGYITYEYQYIFSMKNIGKIAKHLSFSVIDNFENYPTIEKVLPPNNIDALPNSAIENITFAFVTRNDYWIARDTNFSFEVTYRDTFGDERTMPLILTVEPYLYSDINNPTYTAKLRENTKELR